MLKAPTSPLRLILAANLRSSRKRLGISQEELADRAHVHRTYVGAVERGEVNLSVDNTTGWPLPSAFPPQISSPVREPEPAMEPGQLSGSARGGKLGLVAGADLKEVR